MARPKNLLQTKPRASRANSPAWAVIGLRNPGPDYEGTRHNSGFEVVARVLARADEKLGRAPSRVRAQVAQVGVGDDRILYAVPVTFMNESGRAVRSLIDYFGLSPESLLVVHDDIDLPFGRLKLQVDGGSGGNNGVRSIESALGSNGFSRLKIGVGRPPGEMDPADFVLRRFSRSELPEVELMIEDAADIVVQWPTDPDRAQEMAALRGRKSHS
ncbi:MAG: aminoacyl-tRNA hydrolase [Acidimicrobiia bacterium]